MGRKSKLFIIRLPFNNLKTLKCSLLREIYGIFFIRLFFFSEFVFCLFVFCDKIGTARNLMHISGIGCMITKQIYIFIMLTTSFYDESMPKYKHFSIQPGNKPIKMHSEPFWFVQISKQNQTDVQISSVFSFISYVKYNHKNVSPLQHSLLKEKAFKIKILQ